MNKYNLTYLNPEGSISVSDVRTNYFVGGCVMAVSKKKDNQYELILQTAYECISTKGYANVSMRDVAEKAGVALSQITYHFKNKDGLLTEVVNTMAQEYLTEIEDYLRTGNDPKQKLANLIKYFQVVLEEKPELFKLFYDFTSMAVWSPDFSKQINDLFSKFVKLIETHILNDISLKSNLKNYTPKSIARILLGAMFGTALQVIMDPSEKELPNALDTLKVLLI